MTVYGDGGQRCDFTFVDDAVEATIACLTRRAPEFAYNVGGGHLVPVGELPERMEQVTVVRLAREHAPVLPGGAPATAADTARTRRGLDSAPRTDRKEGLARRWEWHRSR